MMSSLFNLLNKVENPFTYLGFFFFIIILNIKSIYFYLLKIFIKLIIIFFILYN